MAEPNKYRDNRAKFWREQFASGKTYDRYLSESDPIHADKWSRMAAMIPPLDEVSLARLRGHGRDIKVLVYSGVWCGDCVRQGPMIRQLAEAVGDDADLRFVERNASEALQEELRIIGALRVPVLVFLTEDFHEIGRFGDRLLTVYRAKALRELGEACFSGLVPPPADELSAERDEWLDVFERMLLMLRLSPPLRARHGD